MFIIDYNSSVGGNLSFFGELLEVDKFLEWLRFDFYVVSFVFFIFNDNMMVK